MSDEQRVDVGPVWQKLHDAMNGPGLSSYPLRTRIMAIYSASLIDLWPERDLPPDLRELYREIDKAFHRGPAGDPQARAYASTRAMSDRAVEAVARKIARLFDLLSAQRRQDQALAEQGQGMSAL